MVRRGVTPIASESARLHHRAQPIELSVGRSPSATIQMPPSITIRPLVRAGISAIVL